MGSFGGHALPGSFLLLFGVWWTIRIFQRFYQSLRKGSQPFVSTVTFPCGCFCGRLKTWELEGFFKIFFTAVGFAGEIITAHRDGKFTHLGNGQHATMFLFFGLSGFIDVLVHYKVPLPKGIEYITAAQAFLVELLLFVFHLHGRTSLDVMLHHLLLFAIFMSLVSVLVELCYRESVLAALCRAYFVCLQGTWFWHVAFILYPPYEGTFSWNQESHEHMMVITVFFAWHMGGIFIFMIATGATVGLFYQCRGDFVLAANSDGVHLDVMKRKPNGNYKNLGNFEDSNSDEEQFSKPSRINP